MFYFIIFYCFQWHLLFISQWMIVSYLLDNRGPTTKESGLRELDNIAATKAAKSAKKKFGKVIWSRHPTKDATSENTQVKWVLLLLSENSEKKDLILTKAMCEHLPKNKRWTEISCTRKESSKKKNGNFEMWISFTSWKSKWDGGKLPFGYPTSWGLGF